MEFAPRLHMYVWVDGCTVCMCVHVSVNVCVRVRMRQIIPYKDISLLLLLLFGFVYFTCVHSLLYCGHVLIILV